eukprot:g7341.t1
MWLKVIILLICCGRIWAQQTSNEAIEVPPLCSYLYILDENVRPIVSPNDTIPSDRRSIISRQEYDICFELNSIFIRDSCQTQDCVCVYIDNNWEFYESYLRDAIRFVIQHCIYRYNVSQRESMRNSGSAALVGWMFLVILVFALSCCCRCFRNQICCDCCYETRNSSRNLTNIEIGPTRIAAPETEASSSRKPLTGPQMEQVVVVYNPDDEDIKVGVPNIPQTR